MISNEKILLTMELLENINEIEKEIKTIETFTGHKILINRWVHVNGKLELNIPELIEAFKCASELRQYIEETLNYLKVSEITNDKQSEILAKIKEKNNYMVSNLDKAIEQLTLREVRVLYSIIKEQNNR